MTRIITTANGQVRRMRTLGPDQQRLLEGFLTHGSWQRDRNWTQVAPSVALRLLGSLERRDLVERDGECYRLTQQGKLEAARHGRDRAERRYNAFGM